MDEKQGNGAVPRALKLHEFGELTVRAATALASLRRCTLCPRHCGVDRLAGETGVCGIGRHARVASHGLHHGEEIVLVGPVQRSPVDSGRGASSAGSAIAGSGGAASSRRRRGSGTIFFSGCNLCCSFCQNYDISHAPVGPETSAEALASLMIDLQARGCCNINLVTPSHIVPQVLEALPIALDRGLRVPLVYNTGGYDTVSTLKLLDGVIDIYMPDFKFWFGQGSQWMPGVTDYAEIATQALAEMHRQVGDLEIVDGFAVSGLLARHLVMPRHATDTQSIVEFLASISPDTYVNVMAQYRPTPAVIHDAEIGSTLTASEYIQALVWARDAGLSRLVYAR